MLKLIRYIIFMLTLGFSVTACFTPVNMSFETASSLEKKQVEFLGSISTNYLSVQERFGNTNLGIRAGYGLTSAIDLKLFYRMLLNDDENFSSQHIAFYPDITLIPNTLAISPTIGAYVFGGAGGSEVTYVWNPRIHYSFPLSQSMEMTLSTKMDFFLDSNSEQLWGFNVGWNIKGQNTMTNFRPELGILVQPGERPTLWTIGLAYIRIIE